MSPLSINQCYYYISTISIIIQVLYASKAYGHMISIRMRKLCGKSVLKTLKLIFRSCIESGIFRSDKKQVILSQFIKKVTQRY